MMSSDKSSVWLELVDEALLAHERGDMDKFHEIMEHLRMSLEWDTLAETMSPIIIEQLGSDGVEIEQGYDEYTSTIQTLFSLAWDEYSAGNYQSAIDHLGDIFDVIDLHPNRDEHTTVLANYCMGEVLYAESNASELIGRTRELRGKAAQFYRGVLKEDDEIIGKYLHPTYQINCRVNLGIIEGHQGDLLEKEKLFIEALEIVRNSDQSIIEQYELALVTDLTWLATQNKPVEEIQVVADDAAKVMKKITRDVQIEHEAPPAPPAPPGLGTYVPYSDLQGLSIRGKIKRYAEDHWLCQAYGYKIYMDDIPKKKLNNALKHKTGQVSLESDEIIGLIDTTLFGSAKSCVIFTKDGLYWKNGWGSAPSFKKYSEINYPEYPITNPEFSPSILVGPLWELEKKVEMDNARIDFGKGTITREAIIELMRSICADLD